MKPEVRGQRSEVGVKPLDKRIIVQAVAKFQETAYRLGAMSYAECDCFSFVNLFYRECGVSLPERFGQHDISTYMSLYQSHPQRAKLLMLRYLCRLGGPVNPAYLQPGDLAIVKSDQGYAALIYIGAGNYIGVHTPHGVIVVPERSIRYGKIKAVRPCLS